MRTALCDQFGIEYPIFAFSHCRDVVAAVSKAGGFGVLGAVGFPPDQLAIELKWIDEHIGDKPYVWYTADCGKDPIVGAVRGTVAAGMVRASLPATRTGPCALQLRASDRNGIDSNTLDTKDN